VELTDDERERIRPLMRAVQEWYWRDTVEHGPLCRRLELEAALLMAESNSWGHKKVVRAKELRQELGR